MQNYTKVNAAGVQSGTELQTQVVIITGYSGAGKHTMLRSLEDIGFFCVDNLPGVLLQPFFDGIMQQKIPYTRIALGVDVRTDITRSLHKILNLAAMHACSVKIVFLTSSYHMLLKRFQETRRKHPLVDKNTNVSDAIIKEQNELNPVEQMADMILDTNQFTTHQLREFVIQSFAQESRQQMIVTVTAFGFKYGAPLESNLVLDVRFLPNPYFNADLKQLDGTHEKITEYLFSQKKVTTYWDHFISFVRYTITQSLAEGRFSMHIAVGCTGGRHRSVALVHKLVQEHVDHVTFLPRYRDRDKETYQE